MTTEKFLVIGMFRNTLAKYYDAHKLFVVSVLIISVMVQIFQDERLSSFFALFYQIILTALDEL